MSGGCGGGGGSGDSPTPPVSPEPDPGNDFALEDIYEAQSVLDEVMETVFIKDNKKMDSLPFDEYVERLLSSLRANAAVEEVQYYSADNVYESGFVVKFKSGFSQLIGGYNEDTIGILQNNSKGQSINEKRQDRSISLAANNNILLSAEADNTSLLNIIGVEYLMSNDKEEDTAVVQYIELKATASNAKFNISSFIEYENSLAPLRSLQDYDYIIIQAHGSAPKFLQDVFDFFQGSFAVTLRNSEEDAAPLISQTDYEDIKSGRVGVFISMPFDQYEEVEGGYIVT
jgi:hypothetical protein